nr:hypothetical protein CFP56_54178 [Quercus suber]
MNGAQPNMSRRGDGCCEPLPQSVGVKKGLGLGLRLSLSKPRQKVMIVLNYCYSPKTLREKKQPLVMLKLVLLQHDDGTYTMKKVMIQKY